MSDPTAFWKELDEHVANIVHRIIKVPTGVTPGVIHRTTVDRYGRAMLGEQFGAVQVYRTSNQANGGTVSWQASDYDTGGYFSTATPTRLTFPNDGIYAITTQSQWELNTSGQRQLRINHFSASTVQLNTIANVTYGPSAVASGPHVFQASTQIKATAGQWIVVLAEQSGAGTINLIGSGEYDTFCVVAQIG